MQSWKKKDIFISIINVRIINKYYKNDVVVKICGHGVRHFYTWKKVI